MRRVDCQTLLSQDSPDAWVLAVLADFKAIPALAIVHEILARLVQRLNGEPPRLREYVGMLEVLATNRDLNIDIDEELEMLTIDFEKLPTYRLGMKKGIEKGREEGTRAQALAIAARLLAQGMPPVQVAAFTDLALAEVEALKTPPTV